MLPADNYLDKLHWMLESHRWSFGCQKILEKFYFYTQYCYSQQLLTIRRKFGSACDPYSGCSCAWQQGHAQKPKTLQAWYCFGWLITNTEHSAANGIGRIQPVKPSLCLVSVSISIPSGTLYLPLAMHTWDKYSCHDYNGKNTTLQRKTYRPCDQGTNNVGLASSNMSNAPTTIGLAIGSRARALLRPGSITLHLLHIPFPNIGSPAVRECICQMYSPNALSFHAHLHKTSAC